MPCQYNHITKSLLFMDNESNIKNLLTYEGICYWWFMDRWLYDTVTPEYAKERKTIAKIVLLINRFFPQINLLLEMCAHILSSLFITPTCHIDNENKPYQPIFFHTFLGQWRMETENNISKLTNVYYQGIMHELPNNIVPVLCSSEIYGVITLNFRNYLKIRKTVGSEMIFPISYWSIKVWKKERQAQNYFKRQWNFLNKNDKWFQKLSLCTGVDTSLLRLLVHFWLVCCLPLWVTYNNLVEMLLVNKNPKAMLISQEQTPQGRGLLLIAKKHGIPTIGLQHGIIPEHHSGYLYHTKNDMITDNNNKMISFPIPDKTLVWGEKEYNDLIDIGFYPPDSLSIIGNPRYDKLASSSKIYSREIFCKKYKINSSKKLILWTTQSHGWSMEENNAYFDEIFYTISKLPDVALIIKQHPYESIKYYYLIQKYIKKYNHIQVIIPPKNSNTTEMIFACDLVILKNSGSGQEAVVFHKSLIVLDFSKNPDSGHYVKEGVAIGVYERGELSKKLKYCLNFTAISTEKQDAYVKKYMYKIDGDSAKRCVAIIQQYLSN